MKKIFDFKDMFKIDSKTKAVRDFCVGACVVPVILMLDYNGAMMDDNVHTTYRLKNEFKTAYCINTPVDEQTYTTRHVTFTNSRGSSTITQSEPTEHKYPLTPGTTYPLTFICGALGAFIGVKRREHQH